MQADNKQMTIWTVIKRTPASLALWMLIGAMILPARSALTAERSVVDLVVGVFGGWAITIILRAAVVSYWSSRKTL